MKIVFFTTVSVVWICCAVFLANRFNEMSEQVAALSEHPCSMLQVTTPQGDRWFCMRLTP